MTKDSKKPMFIKPDPTAVRVALWRALHCHIDLEPHVLKDEVGLQLVAEHRWRERPDMDPQFSKAMRASIVGRARYIEDLVEEQTNHGVSQYVILGAGLDTFAQRRPDLASRLNIFEIDQPGQQEWKKRRLREIGYSIPEALHFVAVDFEANQAWWKEMVSSGFDVEKPAIVVSTGVSMYLTNEANLEVLQQLTSLSSGSTFAMTFLLAFDLLDLEEQNILRFVMNKAQESGTPFLSLFDPADLLALAKKAGFTATRYISAHEIYQKYFAKRLDDLKAGNAEGFLIATT